MKKILLAICHPDEWNQFICFNSYVSEIKNNYSRVVCVLPYKPYVVMSEVDEIVTVQDGLFFSYPQILNYSQRNSNEFLNLSVNYVLEKYGQENVEIKSWQNTKYDDGKVNEAKGPLDYYQTSFFYAKKFFESGKVIKPTKKIFNIIKKKYQKYFDENTFIILTRNFESKATVHNTSNMLPNLKKTLEFLTNNNIKIVNVGFPPQSYTIKNNYIELNENFTQDELISLFYLSCGVLLQGDAGGFATHYASNVDFYIITEEWSKKHENINISLVESKKTNKTFNVYGKTDEQLCKLLKDNKRPQQLSFSIPKKIDFVKL
jgi:hypothetical protein